MRILTSVASIEALRVAGHHSTTELDLAEGRMREVIAAFNDGGWTWDPEEHGAFVLVEKGDDVRDFRRVGLNPEDQGLVGALWEVATWHPAVRVWEVLVLYSGDTGWSFFVPDAPWLDSALRDKLVAEADVEQPTAPAGVETPS